MPEMVKATEMNDDPSIVPLRQEEKQKLQAADWLAKLDRGDLTAEERADFTDWLAEDPKNKDSIQQAADLWYGLNEPLSRLAPLMAGEGQEEGRANGQMPLGLFGPALARLKVTAFAVAVLLIGVVSASIFLSSPSADVENYYATAVGETRIVDLVDGSQVHLNTDSIIEQSYSGEERVVRLIAGEAIFDVAHDKERPFLVYAADGVIRAVGTRFAVRVAEHKVSVTVTDGRVALARRLDKSMAQNNVMDALVYQETPIMVSKGGAADIGRTETNVQQSVSERDLAKRLSWTTGQLVFYDEDLQSVIDEVARYTTVKIKVMDDALKDKKITGILQIGDVDLMLEGVEAALNIKANRIEPNLVHLTAS
ncbi:FecR family protein [Kordiimonas sp.]|uniref:FecR family protein n=1 Tax=Kordiimonas sp. TaxID=1970157 RepID=UPI003B51B776